MKSAIFLSALAIVGVQAQDAPQGPPKGVGEAPNGAGGLPKGAGGAAKGAGGSTGTFEASTFLGGILAAGSLQSVLSGLSAISSDGKVPLGPAPKGCSTYEVLIGSFPTASQWSRFLTFVDSPWNF
jgi:hypothetical protein